MFLDRGGGVLSATEHFLQFLANSDFWDKSWLEKCREKCHKNAIITFLR